MFRYKVTFETILGYEITEIWNADSELDARALILESLPNCKIIKVIPDLKSISSTNIIYVDFKLRKRVA